MPIMQCTQSLLFDLYSYRSPSAAQAGQELYHKLQLNVRFTISADFVECHPRMQIFQNVIEMFACLSQKVANELAF